MLYVNHVHILFSLSITIQVGGKLDDSTDRITITDKYLEIKNLTKEDHGKYECRAINNIATVVTVTELRIDSKWLQLSSYM